MNMFNRVIVSFVIIPFLIIGLAGIGGAQSGLHHWQVNQVGGGVNLYLSLIAWTFFIYNHRHCFTEK